MTKAIVGYRVFIASPGGLEAEREAFRDTLARYNESESLHSGVLFIPVGWELTLAGVGRPQSLINEEIRDCDYFVLVLWNRWGSAPGGEQGYTSGTEEEFHVAQESLADESLPMKEIVVLFKGVDAQQLSDPGEQLRHVLDFKKRIEEERALLYNTFDAVESFNELVRREIGRWLRDHERGSALRPTPPAGTSASASDGDNADQSASAPIEFHALVEEARRLASSGELTAAEALFARSVAQGNDPEAPIQYSIFLQAGGRLSQAEEMAVRALDLAERSNVRTTEARAYIRLGRVKSARGELAPAEQFMRTALQIYERVADTNGQANALVHLGKIQRHRGRLDEARASLELAAELSKAGEYGATMARATADLGDVLRMQGELDAAESMLRWAINFREETQRTRHLASLYGTLAIVLSEKRRTQEAEEAVRKAISLGDEKGNGRRPFLLITLGNILIQEDKVEEAKAIFEEALRVAEAEGSDTNIAAVTTNLGNIAYRQGDLDGAEGAYRKALDAAVRSQRLENIAGAYSGLGLVSKVRGDLAKAREFFVSSRDLYVRLGMRERKDFMDNLISGLNSKSAKGRKS